MTSRSYIITACSLAVFLLCSHFGINSYFKARQLKAQAETITVRTRLMKHQIGAMEQKMRVLQRASHFVDQAKALRLEPGEWAAYDVNVQKAMTYQKLSEIVEQCVHNDNIYFKPLTFHVAIRSGDTSPADEPSEAESVLLPANGMTEGSSDLSLALKGTFMVRH